MRVWWLLGLILLVVGCASVTPPPLLVPPLPLLQDPAPEPVVEPVLPSSERNHLIDSEPLWLEENPVTVAMKAAKRATMSPSSVGFERGMLVYPYYPYAVYRVDVPLRGSLHVQLQPGEEIRVVGGLRPTDWHVQRDDAQTSLEASHLTVTPQEANLQGRMILLTSKGVYYLDVRSHETYGLYGVSWRHPKASR